MACPNKYNKVAIWNEKIEKYHQLRFELRERSEGYTVELTSTITGCPGGKIKELKEYQTIFRIHFEL